MSEIPMKRAHFSSLTLFYTFTRGKKGECLLNLLSHCKDMLHYCILIEICNELFDLIG